MYAVRLTVSTWKKNEKGEKTGKNIEFVVIFKDETQALKSKEQLYEDLPVQKMLNKWLPGHQMRDLPQMIDEINDWFEIEKFPNIDWTKMNS